MHFGVLFKQLCDHAKAVKLFWPYKRMLTVGSFEAVLTVQFFFLKFDLTHILKHWVFIKAEIYGKIYCLSCSWIKLHST